MLKCCILGLKWIVWTPLKQSVERWTKTDLLPNERYNSSVEQNEPPESTQRSSAFSDPPYCNQNGSRYPRCIFLLLGLGFDDMPFTVSFLPGSGLISDDNHCRNKRSWRGTRTEVFSETYLENSDELMIAVTCVKHHTSSWGWKWWPHLGETVTQ